MCNKVQWGWYFITSIGRLNPYSCTRKKIFVPNGGSPLKNEAPPLKNKAPFHETILRKTNKIHGNCH